jgi:hypothetical protein
VPTTRLPTSPVETTCLHVIPLGVTYIKPAPVSPLSPNDIGRSRGPSPVRQGIMLHLSISQFTSRGTGSCIRAQPP